MSMSDGSHDWHVFDVQQGLFARRLVDGTYEVRDEKGHLELLTAAEFNDLLSGARDWRHR